MATYYVNVYPEPAAPTMALKPAIRSFILTADRRGGLVELERLALLRITTTKSGKVSVKVLGKKRGRK
jgi:hypothetical protein